MRKNIKLYGLLVCVILFLIIFFSYNQNLKSIEKYGPIEIGGPMPGYGGVAQNGTSIGPMTPSGKFFIHFVNADLPTTCLDSECGDVGKYVKEHGGHLIGSSDGKLSNLFGVQIISVRPYKFDASIIVVSDKKGEIIAIYKNAQLHHIRTLVMKHGNE